MWKKFKHWLIRKLGGYVSQPERTFEIKHSLKPLVKLSNAVNVHKEDEVSEERIKDILSSQLGEELREHMEITVCQSIYEEDMETYKAVIEIVKGD